MKKISFIVPLILVSIQCLTFAQTVKFEKIYGASGYEYGYSVTQAFDKGYIVAGSTTSKGYGSTDAYLLKVDSLGALKWDKTYGGINVDQFRSIKQTPDSGSVVVGFTNSHGNGGYDIYIVRTNKLGDSLWTKTLGGDDWDFAYSIENTNDGGFIVAGGTYSYGSGDEDMYLLKLNSTGDTIWTKTYGGAGADEARKVKQTMDGGYLVVGNTQSFGEPNGDMYIVKTDANGDTLWTRRNGGADIDEAYDVIEKTDGEILIGGRTKSIGSGNFDGVVVHYSSMGAFQYNDLYGGSDDDGLYSIDLAANGRFAVSGYTYTYGFGLGTPDFVLYIQNPFNGFHSGNFGGNKFEVAYCISPTADSGYVMVGNSTSYSNLDHIYLIKMDSNGVSSANVINVSTGVTALFHNNGEVSVYPNPADNWSLINLATLPSDNQYKITLVDVMGREYEQENFSNISKDNYRLNTSQLHNGLYIVNIEGENIKVSQRILIQH